MTLEENLNGAIKNCLSQFDFAEALKIMNLMNYTWSGVDRLTVGILYQKMERRLQEIKCVLLRNQRLEECEHFINSGRFTCRGEFFTEAGNEKYVRVSIEFVPVDWESTSGGE